MVLEWQLMDTGTATTRMSNAKMRVSLKPDPAGIRDLTVGLHLMKQTVTIVPQNPPRIRIRMVQHRTMTKWEAAIRS